MERDARRRATGKPLSASVRPAMFRGDTGKLVRLAEVATWRSFSGVSGTRWANDRYLYRDRRRRSEAEYRRGEKKSMQLLSSFMGRHTKRGASLKKGTSRRGWARPLHGRHVTLISFNQSREKTRGENFTRASTGRGETRVATPRRSLAPRARGSSPSSPWFRPSELEFTGKGDSEFYPGDKRYR